KQQRQIPVTYTRSPGKFVGWCTRAKPKLLIIPKGGESIHHLFFNLKYEKNTIFPFSDCCLYRQCLRRPAKYIITTGLPASSERHRWLGERNTQRWVDPLHL